MERIKERIKEYKKRKDTRKKNMKIMNSESQILGTKKTVPKDKFKACII